MKYFEHAAALERAAKHAFPDVWEAIEAGDEELALGHSEEAREIYDEALENLDAVVMTDANKKEWNFTQAYIEAGIHDTHMSE